jgi:hypothetical protein
VKKPITRREFTQAMNYYAASFGKPTTELPKKRAAPTKSDEPTEHQLQVKVINWWSRACEGYKLPVFALYHIPNGGSRHMLEAVNLKAAGVRKGIADLALDVARGPYHGLRIEMKRSKGVVSPEQKEVHQFLAGQGYRIIVAWTAQDAINAIDDYLTDGK